MFALLSSVPITSLSHDELFELAHQRDIETDCASAEADADLMRLYDAIMDQLCESETCVFTEKLGTAARVIMPGRFVDVFVPNSSMDQMEAQTQQLLEKMANNPAEFKLVFGHVCKLMALYIRDHPFGTRTYQVHERYDATTHFGKPTTMYYSLVGVENKRPQASRVLWFHTLAWCRVWKFCLAETPETAHLPKKR